MIYAFIVIIAIIMIIVISVIVAWENERKIEKNGIEVDAIVVRVEKIHNDDGHGSFCYYPYVEYIAEDNQKHEARLNCNINSPIGRKMRVKYLPKKYDYVLFVSQELDELNMP